MKASKREKAAEALMAASSTSPREKTLGPTGGKGEGQVREGGRGKRGKPREGDRDGKRKIQGERSMEEKDTFQNP